LKFLAWFDRRKKNKKQGGNCVEGQFLVRTYSLHAAHSPKDNYSFAVDLKISEILARVGGTVLH
jgi:ferredoxin-NADP reductase